MPWPFVHRARARDFLALCEDSNTIIFSCDRQIRMRLAFLAKHCLVFILVGCAAIVQAQSRAPSSGMFDKDIPVPTEVEYMGQQDAAALTEILAHLKVVGASPWAGMQATGQITYGTEDPTAYSATLSNRCTVEFGISALDTAPSNSKRNLLSCLDQALHQHGTVLALDAIGD
jgi:hypothetical protein